MTDGDRRGHPGAVATEEVEAFCRAFLSEVFASLIVNPSLLITAFVHAYASAAEPRLRITKSSA
jgi:hypothetical protein